MAHVNDMILQAMHFRHACKDFDPDKKVSDEDFDTILESARLSPSSFGLEPWELLVVQNSALRGKLAAVGWGVQRQMPGVSHLVVILARKPQDMMADSDYVQHTMLRDAKQLPEDIARQYTDMYRKFRAEDFYLNDDPRVGFEWAARQCYIALGNMMTTAALLGVDSCAIEGFNIKQLEKTLADENMLDPAHFGVACMVVFGYRAHEPRPATRRTREQVVRWFK